jgi:hydrogen peroxide-dependent heme synthase
MGAMTSKPKARDLNQVIRYTMWSVFRLRDRLPDDRAAVSAACGPTPT